MKCHICDKTLSPEEVHWSKDHGEWDPCGSCLMAIEDVFNDGYDEEQITAMLDEEWGILTDGERQEDMNKGVP
jgi:hypothetical protein